MDETMMDASIWDREQALTILARIANADIRDFIAFRTIAKETGRDSETGEPVYEYTHVVELLDSGAVDSALVQEVSISKSGSLKFKLYDKIKAIEMANKMCGYNEPERVEHSGGVNVIFAVPRPDK